MMKGKTKQNFLIDKNSKPVRMTASVWNKNWSSVNEEDDELPPGEFEVEKIVDRRVSQGNIEYLVNWTGYPESDNSWEPAINLQKCTQLIIDYEKKLNAKRKPVKFKSAIKTRAMQQRLLECKEPPYDITGVGHMGDGYWYEVQWNEGDITRETLPAFMVKENWLMSVIRFYQKRAVWVMDEGHYSDDGDIEYSEDESSGDEVVVLMGEESDSDDSDDQYSDGQESDGPDSGQGEDMEGEDFENEQDENE